MFSHPAPNGISTPYVNPPQPARYVISGVTRDVNNNPLPGCMVEVYESASNLFRASTVSDANGNYAVDVTSSETGLTFQAIAYLPGSPDVAGITVNTLVGTAT
jgi:hypothetical protein